MKKGKMTNTRIAYSLSLLLAASASTVWAVDWIPDPRTRTPTTGTLEQADTGAPIAWVQSLDEALKQAKAEKKPVMIEFYQSWQQWCKVLDERTLANPEIVALSNKFVCLRVDAEKSEALAQKYEVKSYPTVVYLNPAGELIHRVVGFVPAAPFKSEMTKIAKGREPEKEFQKLVRSDPREFRPLVLLGVGYLQRQEWDKAIDAYERALRTNPGMEERETQEIIYSLCFLYDYKKKPEKAEGLLRDLLKTESADKAKVHDILGHVYLSLRRPEQAIQQFEAERNVVEDEQQRKSLDKLIEHIKEREQK